MLHCVKQVAIKGGENEMVDGFYVANLMKEKHPEHYKVLTSIPVDFRDYGTDAYTFHKLQRQYTIG